MQPAYGPQAHEDWLNKPFNFEPSLSELWNEQDLAKYHGFQRFQIIVLAS